MERKGGIFGWGNELAESGFLSRVRKESVDRAWFCFLLQALTLHCRVYFSFLSACHTFNSYAYDVYTSCFIPSPILAPWMRTLAG